MGFINETTVDLDDFFTKLNAFLVSEGWTSDELDLVNGEWGISRDTIFLQARWDTGSPSSAAIFQSLVLPQANSLGARNELIAERSFSRKGNVASHEPTP